MTSTHDARDLRSFVRFYRFTSIYVCIALTIIVVLLLRG